MQRQTRFWLVALILAGFLIALPILWIVFVLSVRGAAVDAEVSRGEAACDAEKVLRFGGEVRSEGVAMPASFDYEAGRGDVHAYLLVDKFAFVEVTQPGKRELTRYHLAELGDPACDATLADEGHSLLLADGMPERGMSVPRGLCIAADHDTRSLARWRYVQQAVTAANGTPGWMLGVQQVGATGLQSEFRDFRVFKGNKTRYDNSRSCKWPGLDYKDIAKRTHQIKTSIVSSRETQYIASIAPDPASPVRRFYASEPGVRLPELVELPKPLPPVQDVDATVLEASDLDERLDATAFGRRFRNPAETHDGLAYTLRRYGSSCLLINSAPGGRCYRLPKEPDADTDDVGIKWVLFDGERLTTVSGLRWRQTQYRHGFPNLWIFEHDLEGRVLARTRVRLPDLGFHDGHVDKPVVDFSKTDDGYLLRVQEFREDAGDFQLLRDVLLHIPTGAPIG